MKATLSPQSPFHRINAAALSLVIFAALFAFSPISASADDESPALEKTPIHFSADAPKKSEPTAKHLLLDGVAKLLLVLAAVFALFWFLRRFQAAGRGVPAPGGAFDVLSLVPLSAKSRLVLVRFGGRLLLLSVTGERIEKLAETGDPDEVARIGEAIKRKGTPQ